MFPWNVTYFKGILKSWVESDCYKSCIYMTSLIIDTRKVSTPQQYLMVKGTLSPKIFEFMIL